MLKRDKPERFLCCECGYQSENMDDYIAHLGEPCQLRKRSRDYRRVEIPK